MKQLKVLFLAADPFKRNALSLDEEIREIDQKVQLSNHRGISLVSAWAVRPDDLRSQLLRHQPDVVHFSGHGTDSGSLVLQGHDGEPQTVSSKALANLLSHFKNTVKLVVLNACFSSTEAKAMVRDLDFAVGMNAAIGDEAARCFSAAFYETLASREKVRMAFDLGCNAIELEGLNEHTKPQLYVRKGLSANAVLVAENPPTGESKSRPSTQSVFLSPAAIAGYFAIVAAIIGIIPPILSDRDDSGAGPRPSAQQGKVNAGSNAIWKRNYQLFASRPFPVFEDYRDASAPPGSGVSSDSEKEFVRDLRLIVLDDEMSLASERDELIRLAVEAPKHLPLNPHLFIVDDAIRQR